MFCFKKVFVIEGNIGSGKSTLLSLLKKHDPSITIVPEPVSLWKNIADFNLLEAFYKNPKRWAFTFELYSMLTLLQSVKTAIFHSEGDVIIAERSIFSNRAFQILSGKSDFCNNAENEILTELYCCFKDDYPALNGVIKINTDINTCFERITKRGRLEETQITIDYLRDVENTTCKLNYECPILEIDGKYKLESPKDIINNIIKFINEN